VRQHHRLLLVATAVLALFGLAFGFNKVQAASNGGITVSPAYQDVTLSPNQVSASQEFFITNNEALPLTFDLTTVDMGALNDSGGVVFTGLTADYESKYGLAKWINLKQATVTIAARSTQKIEFDIVVDDSFGPGGHYGAIVAKPVFDISPNQNQIQLSPRIASLLLVKKVGGEVLDLTATNPTIKSRYWKLPDVIKLSFHNKGNVHLVPRGLVIISDSAGHEVGRGVINPESSYTLPELSRNYSVKINYSKNILWPGKYLVKTAYRFDGSDQLKVQISNIRLLNLPLIAAIIILPILLLIIIVRINRRFGRYIKIPFVFVAKLISRTRVFKWLNRRIFNKIITSKAVVILTPKIASIKPKAKFVVNQIKALRPKPKIKVIEPEEPVKKVKTKATSGAAKLKKLKPKPKKIIAKVKVKKTKPKDRIRVLSSKDLTLDYTKKSYKSVKAKTKK